MRKCCYVALVYSKSFSLVLVRARTLKPCPQSLCVSWEACCFTLHPSVWKRKLTTALHRQKIFTSAQSILSSAGPAPGKLGAEIWDGSLPALSAGMKNPSAGGQGRARGSGARLKASIPHFLPRLPYKSETCSFNRASGKSERL